MYVYDTIAEVGKKDASHWPLIEYLEIFIQDNRMGIAADRRNQAVRTLYEVFGAPVDLLEYLSGRVDGGVRRQIKLHGWNRNQSTQTMLKKMLEAFDQQLAEFNGLEAQQKCDDTRVKLLATMAKTLETIAAAEVRMSSIQKCEGENRESITDNKNRNALLDEFSGDDQIRHTPEGEADLNQQIAALVETLP